MGRAFVFGAILLACAASVSAETLNANATANNGGSPNWAIFFDVSANSLPLTITEMTSASTAPANGAFAVEVFTRTGTALGGPVGSGPGSSPAGWTSLGVAPATQGPVGSGISLPIDIPDINVAAGVTGVAVRFTGAGPRYFGLAAGPYQNFSDANLTLVTGDARSAPFTPTGSWFAPRGLTGSLTYQVVPEPASLALLGFAGLLLARRR